MGEELKAGDQAPDFSLQNESGKPVSLTSLRGKQVILYFYPKDDTPGCTKEACSFRDSLKRVEKAGSVVLGVSLDDGESHRKFIAKHRLPFPLLSDVNTTVSKAYGVYKQKHMYGKKFWGIERSTFVIGEAGIIKAVFRKVKVDGHVDEVLAALKAARANSQ
ncbi:MAG: thioredoxin-dependent thiol peroxidase [Nitrospiraceae bacterium]